MRPCPVPGCDQLVVSGRCLAHRQSGGGVRRATERSRRLYGLKRWKLLSRRIIGEEPWCRSCRQNLATEVDHIRPIEDGGDPWDRANLQPLCHVCHSRKTADDLRRRVY